MKYHRCDSSYLAATRVDRSLGDLIIDDQRDQSQSRSTTRFISFVSFRDDHVTNHGNCPRKKIGLASKRGFFFFIVPSYFLSGSILFSSLFSSTVRTNTTTECVLFFLVPAPGNNGWVLETEGRKTRPKKKKERKERIPVFYCFDDGCHLLEGGRLSLSLPHRMCQSVKAENMHGNRPNLSLSDCDT